MSPGSVATASEGLSIQAIALLVSIGTMFVNFAWNAWTSHHVRVLQRNDKEREKAQKERDVMKHYQVPLLLCVRELDNRIMEIVEPAMGQGEESLLCSFQQKDDFCRNYFAQSTVFRIAQVLGWIEIIRREIQDVHAMAESPIGQRSATVECEKVLQNLATVLSTDVCRGKTGHVKGTAHNSAGSRVSVWASGEGHKHRQPFQIFREYQRAIAESMFTPSKDDVRKLDCKGFAEFYKMLMPLAGGTADGCDVAQLVFLELFKDVFSVMKDAAELSDPEAQHRHDMMMNRLVSLQHELFNLMELFDPLMRGADDFSIDSSGMVRRKSTKTTHQERTIEMTRIGVDS